MPDDPSWVDQRTEAAHEHRARLEARAQVEHAKAREIISRFMPVARERGLAPAPLRAKAYSGRGSARSNVSGWYLRHDSSVGLGDDGEFYVLSAPLGPFDRLTGVTLEPSPPPLVLGAGGKDGDSIALVDALERLLPGWRGTRPASE